MMYNRTMKTCSLCHIEKPLSQFYKDSSLPKGYRSKCKGCYNKATYRTRLRKQAIAKGTMQKIPREGLEKSIKALQDLYRTFEDRSMSELYGATKLHGAAQHNPRGVMFRRTTTGLIWCDLATPQGNFSMGLHNRSLEAICAFLIQHNLEVI